MFVALTLGALGLGWSFAAARLVRLAGNEAGILSGAAGFLSAPSMTMIAKLYYKQALAVSYGCGLLLLLSSPVWVGWLRPLASLGRMALTNYLMQCIIAAVLFYGFGVYGKLGPAAAALFAAGVYVLQIPLSAWWLRRCSFGPLEWVWRSLSYGRLQSMRAG